MVLGEKKSMEVSKEWKHLRGGRVGFVGEREEQKSPVGG